MAESGSLSSSERVSQFLDWFSALEAEEQDVLMTLVKREKQIRDAVNCLGDMGLEQRREVFDRLGLPSDLATRIAAAEPARLGEADVEWVDWKAPAA